MDVGGVGGLRNVKNAISVARKVLEHTKHSLLGGNLATDFAVNMGFKKESLQTNESKEMWMQWKTNKCQPNFWKVLKKRPLLHLLSAFYFIILSPRYLVDILAVSRTLYQIQQPAADRIIRVI